MIQWWWGQKKDPTGFPPPAWYHVLHNLWLPLLSLLLWDTLILHTMFDRVKVLCYFKTTHHYDISSNKTLTAVNHHANVKYSLNSVILLRTAVSLCRNEFTIVGSSASLAPLVGINCSTFSALRSVLIFSKCSMKHATKGLHNLQCAKNNK